MPKVKNTKHKVQIENLPEGFELVNGDLIRKAHGGSVTGDQRDYGLVTYNPHANESSEPKDTDVRYSLSSVPREHANIEAEGGETILTDLNNDGQFGLYDIKGPRHGSGGVPMFVPEQSFIFSDTQKMKMGKEMLSEHGIQSRKKMTPAKVSKQYELNKFYGLLNDEYADNIQRNTSDLMLQKNKEGLSKLAFNQEMMKDFEEGLPLAAYPYIQSIGIDPFEFAERVNGLQQFTGDQQDPQMNQADMQAMSAMRYGGDLPRAQFAGQPQTCGEGMEWDQMTQTCVPLPGAPTTPPMSAMSNMLYAAQDFANQNQENFDFNRDVKGIGSPFNDYEINSYSGEEDNAEDNRSFGEKAATGFNNFIGRPATKAFGEASKFVTAGADVINEMFKNKKGRQAEQDMLKQTMADNAFGTSYGGVLDGGIWDTLTGKIYGNMQGDPSVGGGFAGYYSKYGREIPKAQAGLEPGTELIGGSPEWIDYYKSDAAKNYRDKRYVAYQQRRKSADFLDRAKKRKLEDGLLSPEDYHDLYVRGEKQIYGIQDFYKDRGDYLTRGTWDKHYDWDTSKYKTWREAKAAGDPMYKNKGQNWMYNQAIDDMNAAGGKYKAMTPQEIAQFESGYIGGQMLQDLTPEQVQDMEQKGLDDQIVEIAGKKYAISPESGYAGNTWIGQQETYIVPDKPEEPDVVEPEEVRDVNVPDVEYNPPNTIKAPWIQDVLKTQAIANRERDMFLPWEPPVRRNYMAAALEDPTAAIAARNSQLAAAQEALGAFGGRNAMTANLAAAQGQAAQDIANVVSGVNQRNVGTVNQANQFNAQLENRFNETEALRNTRQYDNTMKTLQTYMDEKNFDREQYADALANQITNMSNTYNQNQLYDYFNIDPLSGGDIRQTGAKAFQPNSEQDEWAFMNDYMEAAKRAETLGLLKDGKDNYELIAGLVAQKNKGKGYTDPREAAWKAQGRDYMSGYGGYQNKKGGEKKMRRWASPFYVGKTGI
jgi:hypothetical protein